MTADLLALFDSDPAAGILAAADLREQQAQHPDADRAMRLARQHLRLSLQQHWMAGYIAAEANPVHALAAVRRWRGVVERHTCERGAFDRPLCRTCGEVGGGWHFQQAPWPCPGIRETADEARAYLDGAL